MVALCYGDSENWQDLTFNYLVLIAIFLSVLSIFHLSKINFLVQTRKGK